MDGVEFFALAVTLSHGSSPAELRSGCHTKLQFILQHTGDKTMTDAGLKLNSLRSARNIADYHMDDARYERKGAVVISLKMADEIITSLDNWFSSGLKGDAREAIRDYAKNTLGLMVV